MLAGGWGAPARISGRHVGGKTVINYEERFGCNPSKRFSSAVLMKEGVPGTELK